MVIAAHMYKKFSLFEAFFLVHLWAAMPTPPAPRAFSPSRKNRAIDISVWPGNTQLSPVQNGFKSKTTEIFAAIIERKSSAIGAINMAFCLIACIP